MSKPNDPLLVAPDYQGVQFKLITSDPRSDRIRC